MKSVFDEASPKAYSPTLRTLEKQLARLDEKRAKLKAAIRCAKKLCDRGYPQSKIGGMTVSEFNFEKEFGPISCEAKERIETMKRYDKDVMRRVSDTATAKAATALVNAESKTLHMIRGHNKDNTHLTKSDVRDIVRQHDKDVMRGVEERITAAFEEESFQRKDYATKSDVRDIVREELAKHTKGEWHTPQFADTTKPDAEPPGVYVEPGDVVHVRMSKGKHERIVHPDQGRRGNSNIRYRFWTGTGFLPSVAPLSHVTTLDNQPVLGVREREHE